MFVVVSALYSVCILREIEENHQTSAEIHTLTEASRGVSCSLYLYFKNIGFQVDYAALEEKATTFKTTYISISRTSRSYKLAAEQSSLFTDNK